MQPQYKAVAVGALHCGGPGAGVAAGALGGGWEPAEAANLAAHATQPARGAQRLGAEAAEAERVRQQYFSTAAGGRLPAAVEKYYGKWPFVRLLGMQELATAAPQAPHALQRRTRALSGASASSGPPTSAAPPIIAGSVRRAQPAQSDSLNQPEPRAEATARTQDAEDSRAGRSTGPGLGRRGVASDEDGSSASSEDEYELPYGAGAGGAGGAVDSDSMRAVRGKEDFIRSELYYQRKLEAVQVSYREQEELVWEHLSGLVRDAAWLKAFVAGSMLDIKEALQALVLCSGSGSSCDAAIAAAAAAAAGAHDERLSPELRQAASAVALGPCKLPLPAFPRFNAGAEYGAIGDPTPLIADAPAELRSAAAAAVSPLALAGGGAGLRDVAAALRARRITAQPLQTSADLTTPRYGPVPPVARGMPGVPADEVAAAPALLPAPGAAAGGGVAAGTATAGGGGGGGVIGAIKDLASEVYAASKQGPVMTPAGGAGAPVAAGGY
ncbi:hypothetical protein TSOC_007554 [Tetrabaena socialis]|uniref:Post-GPI attachment to proteins factor 3 n=1 Tax=Tetrabaena socialis TaxID=47790 RepID=A0A2J8A0R9_9CHLO|nr:hypothetical protein TSOC_007554 [Tetrabaena socialis]|eukprot:PNH06117.1 hypothetical protein TSOC_007554 [Tetrabaena socialis]